jgi:hypothetical protein
MADMSGGLFSHSSLSSSRLARRFSEGTGKAMRRVAHLPEALMVDFAS